METSGESNTAATKTQRRRSSRSGASGASSDWVIGKHLRYKGQDYKPGDAMPLDMADHLRFQSLVSGGYLRAVLR